MAKKQISTKFFFEDRVKFRKWEAEITAIQVFADAKQKPLYNISYHNPDNQKPTKISSVPEKELKKLGNKK